MRMRFFAARGVRALLSGLLLHSALASAQEVDPLAPLPEASAPLPVTTSPVVAPRPATPARQMLPGRQGYAFEHPRILLRQRLLGLGHGLRLLGRTCLFVPRYSEAAEQAYATWLARQGDALEAMSLELERWYFGEQSHEPDGQQRLRDIVRALGLRTELRPMSDAERDAACASFAQAIASERYDFVRLLESAEQELTPAPAPAPKPTEAPPEVPPEVPKETPTDDAPTSSDAR